MSTNIIHADVLTGLASLPDGSVQCVVTSPPYYGLRDYGVPGQLGSEERPDCAGWATGAPCGECYICHMVAVFREVWRVLRDDGTLWLNMGDSYASNTKGDGAPSHLQRRAIVQQHGGHRMTTNILALDLSTVKTGCDL